jgi:5-deoxy-D-glucuronate isomerase
MAGAYPKAVPEALVICAAVTQHRHVEADQAVESMAVNSVDIAVAPGATQEREGRVMDQPPAHAQRNRDQRTQNQGKTDDIGQGDSCHKNAELIVKTVNTTQNHSRYPPEPFEQRAADIQPLEDQKDTKGNDHQPNDLEPVNL